MIEPRSITFKIESRLDFVALIGRAVNSLCTMTPLSEVDAYQAELCVVEAVTNAIKHAYGNSSASEVEVKITLFSSKMMFEVSDNGEEFKKFSIPELSFDPNTVEQLPESGMGLHIISKVMDEINYFSKNGVNTLRMTKFY